MCLLTGSFSDVSIHQDRIQLIEAAVSQWNFSAHDFTDEELIHAACFMLEHALQIPELEPWRISTGELELYVQVCRLYFFH